VLGARRESRLAQVAREIAQAGGRAITEVTDVTKRQDSEKLLQTAMDQFGRVDVWINNAGIMALAPMDKVKVSEWERMIDVNVKGVLYGIACALPQMRQRQSGHIINVASVAGLKVFSPIGAVYSATKFAVRAISEGLRAEAGPHLRVTAICPGAVESELAAGSSDVGASQTVQEFYRTHQIPATSVARAIAYAIEQPAEVDVNEIVIRPTIQEF
jgi:NADP-dependent 3-hydroxy acid dehydrogenase YdfG